MKNLSIGKIILYLIIAFVVVSIWKDPQGSASAAGTFLSSLGRFAHTVGHKSQMFMKNI